MFVRKQHDKAAEIDQEIFRLINDTRGTTAIEYGLIAGFLSIAILVSVTNVGTAVVNFFTAVAAMF